MNGASGGQTIYTVPTNKYFKGYIYLNTQTTPAPQINGVEINVNNMNAGYNYEAPLIPVTLIAGTVVKTHANTSGSYYTYVTGAEYNA
jgi:hypothetical protein